MILDLFLCNNVIPVRCVSISIEWEYYGADRTEWPTIAANLYGRLQSQKTIYFSIHVLFIPKFTLVFILVCFSLGLRLQYICLGRLVLQEHFTRESLTRPLHQ